MQQKLTLLYDGYYCDVTSFVGRHPGGELIHMYLNNKEDATHAIHQFHFRSEKRILGILSTLPRRKATENELLEQHGQNKLSRHRQLTMDFNALFQELKDEGLFEPCLFEVVKRFLEITLLNIIGTLLFSGGWTIFGIFFLCWGGGRSGWFIHEAGHHSLTGNSKIDRFLHSFVHGLYLGLSGACWRNHHSKHHAMPQHWQNDVDLHTLPLMAFNSCVLTDPTKQFNFFIKYQHRMVFLVQSTIIGLWWKYIEDPLYAWRNGYYFDLFFMMLHQIQLYNIGLYNYFIISIIVLSYLGVNTTLSHTHLEVTTEPTHWVEYGLTHTANVRSSWWVDYFMGNLNYQIEHHLFPTMPQFRNKLARDKVKALAKKHNLKYHLYDYWTILKMTLKNLSNVSEDIQKIVEKID